MLFLYAIAFSIAYVRLSAGAGALILFGSVQATMLIVAIAGGQRPTAVQWLGLLLALSGLVYLVLPGLSAPPLGQALVMSVAGIAWGVYSLRGRGASDPIAATAGNFVRAVPMVCIMVFVWLTTSRVEATTSAAGWALVSGAVTSGLGYVIWYAALPSLGATRAAIVQLLVPILAAVAGVLLLNEELSSRLILAAALTLTGVSLAIYKKPSGKQVT